ncbi:MAG: Ribosomal RNA small subunit methyltransferase B [Nitrospirae bacterium]|mgnify:CR=1 FL=1|nr:Ribosomal RNA small subunit methyltransferase B [Nitrospirota bacterium]MCE7964607.1 16S rRNA (cytosine(967)-C(5))-methyltransferase RsmB [Nitrospira sp. NTP2]MCK6493799.1 16S rRNA (cytosine(967)-C(5))-methyltransferase RsmB [Nitrospira sp.]MEB2338297.1 16S rRNA (cytosine(967)-C(5))-methyltransferase RsmB [Nitrospirales bacterium]QOJ35131.1 MAG: 16S rRNA (cytosine(967)-C(5))-methyltransferase RsmB [Nitrospira sp.]
MTSNQQPHGRGQSVSSGRRAALKALLAIEKAGLLPEDLFDQVAARDGLDLRDRAFMVELVRGCLRYRGTLDWRLGLLTDRPFARLPLAVQTILRLGAYQALCLDRVPDNAAVNESVGLMKGQARRLGRDWSGFVNAVLRTLLRTPEPPWPDLAKNPIEALAVRYSCPTWLVERWCRARGGSAAEALCRASLESPPLTCRVNTLRMSRSALLETWVAEAIEAVPTAISPVGLQLVRGGVITDLPGYADGQFYVEDEAAQLVPPLLDVQPGQLVLDACAAPGGKATHLAALMKNQGEIVAVDRAAARLTRVMDNCRRLGVTIVRPVVGDVANLPGGDSTAATSTWPSLRSIAARGRPFDRILLDAPCSGLGVLRRHPEGKWYKQAETIARHRETQRRLLEATSRLLRPDGVLVYSTCSVEPEETESIIDEFCQSHRDFQRESVAPWVPPTGLPFVTPRGDLSTMANMNSMDAFFAARLRRSVE